MQNQARPVTLEPTGGRAARIGRLSEIPNSTNRSLYNV
jgi:hypothetical protein